MVTGITLLVIATVLLLISMVLYLNAKFQEIWGILLLAAIVAIAGAAIIDGNSMGTSTAIPSSLFSE